MGLGKTVQAIAAAEIMARLFGVERVLVICPTSLKHQWQREIERFVDRTVEVVGGMRRRREDHFATNTFYKVMNYDTVHADLDLIERWGPALVILDEAQRIKNWNTRVARIVEKWRRYRFLSEADQRRLMIAMQRMRMACDNSYLVDHKHDFGVKAQEAVTLLEEFFERPGTKVVIFSQWLRMHELIVRKLQE